MASDRPPVGVSTPGSMSIFLQNRLAVAGVAIIAVFSVMVVLHPLLMATLWGGKSGVYDPVTGYDAPILEATVVATVTDPATEISLVEARTYDITANVGD